MVSVFPCRDFLGTTTHTTQQQQQKSIIIVAVEKRLVVFRKGLILNMKMELQKPQFQKYFLSERSVVKKMQSLIQDHMRHASLRQREQRTALYIIKAMNDNFSAIHYKSYD